MCIFNFNRYIQMVSRNTSNFTGNKWENFSIISTSSKSLPLSNFCLGHDCKVISYYNLHFSISELEYLFICLLAIWVCSSVNCLFTPFVNFSCGIVSVCHFVRALCIAWVLTFASSVLKMFSQVFDSLLTCKLLPLILFR